MKSHNLLLLVLASILFCELPDLARAMTVEEALKLSRESGKPLLIVSGRLTCGNTKAVLGYIQDPALAPALAPYQYVFVDVDGAEGGVCQKKFGYLGNTLPYVYIVRSDGEKLYDHFGFLQGNEFRDALLSMLAKAGKALSEKETALVTKALEDAKRARKNGDLAEAVKSLLPLKKVGPLGSIPSFVGPGLEANKLVAELTAEGKNMLKKVDEECAEGEPTLDAMLVYVKARRAFAALPTLKADLIAAGRKYDHRRSSADLLAQAAALDRAEVAAAAHDTKKAADAFKKIVSAYPDTEAAKRAAEQLKKLSEDGAETPAASDSKSVFRTWSDTTGQFKVKARLAGVEDGKASFETEDGRKMRVPLAKLSEADRQFLISKGY
jgi:hypothetical protein